MPFSESSRIEATFTDRTTLPDGTVRIVCSPTPLALKIDGEPVTRTSIEAERDTLIDKKTALTREEEERLALLEEAASLHERHLRATVTLDTAPPGDVSVRGRSWWSLRTAVAAAGVKYPYHTVWVDGADKIPGTIVFPKTTYSSVYLLKEDEKGAITVEYLKEPAPGEKEPKRPYYVKENGQTTVYVDGFSGAGTEEDPWQVEDYTDLTKVGCEDTSGDWEGWDLDSYYEQTEDIWCPVERGTTTSSADTTITDSSKSWTTNELEGKYIVIEVDDVGIDIPDARLITANTATTITVDSAWTTNPAAGKTFRIFSDAFEPIGDDTDQFEGVYQGNGYAIFDLYLNREGYFTALFGETSSDALIEDLALINIINLSYGADTNRYSGTIIGRSRGTVNRCIATGYHRQDSWYCAGFIGQIFGPVNDCYVNVRSHSVGSSRAYRGGFAGQVAGGSAVVSRCYSLGLHNGTGSYNDHFIGLFSGGGSSTDCFVYNHGSATGATPKSATELKDIATYTDTETEGLTNPWNIVLESAFDPENPTTWWIDHENDYPRLWYEFPAEPDESEKIAASASGESTAAVALQITRCLASSASGTGAAAGAITATAHLTATASGIGTAAGDLTATSAVQIAASASGEATATADLLRTVPLTATASGTGTAAGDITISGTVALSATASGESTATVALLQTHRIQSAASGVGAASGTLRIVVPVDLARLPPLLTISATVLPLTISATVLPLTISAAVLDVRIEIMVTKTLTGNTLRFACEFRNWSGDLVDPDAGTGTVTIYDQAGAAVATIPLAPEHKIGTGQYAVLWETPTTDGVYYAELSGELDTRPAVTRELVRTRWY